MPARRPAASSTSACQKDRGSSLSGVPNMPESRYPRNSTRWTPRAAVERATSAMRRSTSVSPGPSSPSGTSPTSPRVPYTTTTRCPWSTARASVPAVVMHSSSGWAWNATRVAIGAVLPRTRSGAVTDCGPPSLRTQAVGAPRYPAGMSSRVRQTFALATPWQTIDPFLFVMHHRDDYPNGNAQLGPDASLAGRAIGQDFSGTDGWSMYHGATVPGFPQHPHRGFETITYVRSGLIDHADSLGAAARYGRGDTQWLTAGAGVVHAEMFPLVDPERPNPLELFQIWINLPAADKMAEPHFTMLWNEDTPRFASVDDAGRSTEVVVVAGAPGGHRPPSPPPSSG